MENIHLIISVDTRTITTRLNEIKMAIPDAEVVTYDLSEVSIDTVIEDLDTLNFLTTKKLIIAENAYFLTGDKTKQIVEHNLKKLENYILNPNPENYLILICSSLDKRKKLTSHILEHAKVYETDINIKEIIQNNLEDYKMDKNNISYLIEYCNFNNEIIIKELEKLKLYKLSEKEITKDDINSIVSREIDNNIYKLVDEIIRGNKKESLKLYNSLILHGEQINNIITKLANKIRLIYQVKILLSEGKSDLDISKLLNVHSYPVKLARESSFNYTEKILLEYLEKLAKMDYNIKSGLEDQNIIFETWIASI